MKKKKNLFIYIFISVNLVFIFLQIHKQSNFVKLSYKKQRLEKEKDLLTQKKDNLNQKLLELKKPQTVKNFAAQNLNMKKTSIKQIRKAVLPARHSPLATAGSEPFDTLTPLRVNRGESNG